MPAARMACTDNCGYNTTHSAMLFGKELVILNYQLCNNACDHHLETASKGTIFNHGQAGMVKCVVGTCVCGIHKSYCMYVLLE